MTGNRRAAAVAAVVVAIAVGAIAPAASPSSHAAEGATLRLASQTAWVGAGEPFILRLQVAGVPRPDRVELRVAVHNRVLTRSAFGRTLEGKSLGPTISSITARLDELPLDPGRAVLVILSPPGLTLRTGGVYPVEVTLRERETGSTIDRLVTYLLHVTAGTDVKELGVAWIVPLQATGDPPSPAPLGTIANDLASPTHRDIPLVLAPMPDSLDQIATRGGDSARAALRSVRLSAPGRQIVARPYAPIDPAALLAAGLSDEVAAQRDRGAEVLTSTLGTRPDPNTWVADEGLDHDSLDRLRDQQVDQFVVNREDLTPLALTFTLAQPFALEGRLTRRPDAVLADPGLRDHFINGGDQVLAAHQFLADLAVIWQETPTKERGVVALPSRRWVPTRTFLDAALDGLARSPLVLPISLDRLFASIDPATTRSGAPLVRRLVNRRAATLPGSTIRTLRRQIDAIGSTVPVGSEIYADFDHRLLAAEAAGLSSRDRTDALDTLRADIAKHIRRVVLPQPRTLTLTAREGEIPLTVDNATPSPMTVVVRLDSDKLEFPQRPARTVDLAPRRTTTIRFAVRARAAGNFPVAVRVVAPSGDLTLATTRFTVRSTAASWVGVALTAGAGAILVLWWGRYLWRSRRTRT